jgi:ribonuclease T2
MAQALWRWRIGRAVAVAAVLIATALVVTVFAAEARDMRRDIPGEFDFYVLALSWSPSFCAAARERGQMGRSQQVQCGGRPYSFVVHGLWPQYERGYPASCERPAPRLDRRIVSDVLDLMPAPGLIYNEWDKHGTCSGLGPRGYFEAVRRARAAIKVPPEFAQLAQTRIVAPVEGENAFRRVNPGLSQDAIAVMCDRNRLSEVRICMDKALRFRACDEVDRRACRSNRVTMPPVR